MCALCFAPVCDVRCLSVLFRFALCVSVLFRVCDCVFFSVLLCVILNVFCGIVGCVCVCLNGLSCLRVCC